MTKVVYIGMHGRFGSRDDNSRLHKWTLGSAKFMSCCGLDIVEILNFVMSW